MKKIINYLKNLIKKFTSRKKKKFERCILNNRYCEDTELIKFVQERKKTLGENSMPFVIIWDDFPIGQYGKVELVWNNKVVHTAKLMRSKHNFVYWQFNE